jgi:RNA polymerase sigma-70 factor (ECF subfamily)
VLEDFSRTLEAARGAQEWAWRALYEDLAPSVLGYVRGRGVVEAEDVTAEVFLQVVRDLDSFRGDQRDFRSWVFVIAHHRLVDERRRRARRPLEAAGDEPAERISSDGVADEALESLTQQRIRSVIEQLAPDQATVLLLRVLGQLTVDEVAGVMGKSPGAVKALQRRGLRSLTRALGNMGVTL